MNNVLKVIGWIGLYIVTFVASAVVLAVLGFIVMFVTQFFIRWL